MLIFIFSFFLFFLQACFTAGMFALGAKDSKDEKHYLNLAAGLANTCHESYIRTGKQNIHNISALASN